MPHLRGIYFYCLFELIRSISTYSTAYAAKWATWMLLSSQLQVKQAKSRQKFYFSFLPAGLHSRQPAVISRQAHTLSSRQWPHFYPYRHRETLYFSAPGTFFTRTQRVLPITRPESHNWCRVPSKSLGYSKEGRSVVKYRNLVLIQPTAASTIASRLPLREIRSIDHQSLESARTTQSSLHKDTYCEFSLFFLP